jgi:nucleoside-diphosphate-sugar epimerase
MMTIVIAGIGYVGARLANLAGAAGHSVYGIKRSAASNATDYVPIEADLTQFDSLTGRLPKTATHLVLCAGPSVSSEAAYRDLFIRGTANVCALLPELPKLERIAFVSSTSVYAQQHGEWVDESSLTQPEAWSGQTLLEAEAMLTNAGISATVLRCAGIYGPGRTRLIDSVRNGTASFDPDAPQYMNRIHGDDVAGALLHLLQPSIASGIYLGVDEAPSADREVVEWLAATLKVPPPQPAPSTKAERSPRRGASNKRCSNAKLVATGYQYVYPTYRQGYGDMLRST